MNRIGFQIRTLQRSLDRLMANMIHDSDPFQKEKAIPAGKVREALP